MKVRFGLFTKLSAFALLLNCAFPDHALAQLFPRNMVLVELGTAIECYYCPGAALGVDDLLANGCKVAIIANHERDPFENTGSANRNAFNKLIGFPTAKFDGVYGVMGGDPDSSIYPYYLPRYTERIKKPTGISLTADITRSGTLCSALVRIARAPGFAPQNPVLWVFITQSNIPFPWLGQPALHHVNRMMIPDENGTRLDFGANDTLSVMLMFHIDSSWPADDCEFIAVVQDSSTLDVYNTVKQNLGQCYPAGRREDPHPVPVSVSPNPGRGVFTLVNPFPGSPRIMVTLLNMTGVTVYSNEILFAPDVLSATFNPGNLPRGLYLVTVTGEHRRVSCRLVVD